MFLQLSVFFSERGKYALAYGVCYSKIVKNIIGVERINRVLQKAHAVLDI
jgi:hypothetical protein